MLNNKPTKPMIVFKPLLLFGAVSLLIVSCNQVAETAGQSSEAETVAPDPTPAKTLPVSWDLTATELQGDTTIFVPNDGFLKTEKRYQAYPLSVNLAPLVAGLDTAGLSLTFVCVDGYMVSMPYSTLLEQEAYLAYRDLDAAGDWPEEYAKTFPPFYLVWPAWSGDLKVYPWPFGLFEIRITRFEEEYAAAFPKDEGVERGFHLFTAYCIKCHSINQVGGIMGPEFNYPKNITEYWAKEDIWSFAQNPQSYRYNSKMPAVPDLKREEFEEIYQYLQAMKDQKPAPTQ